MLLNLTALPSFGFSPFGPNSPPALTLPIQPNISVGLPRASLNQLVPEQQDPASNISGFQGQICGP